MRKTFFKLSRDYYPQHKDRYPMLYFEHGRMEVDDSSVKWIGANRDLYEIPVAAISTILLGPGTTVTHEAIKAISASNTTICWVGDDSLKFYAAGITTTSDTQNLLKQINCVATTEKRLCVARRMFAKRFPGVNLEGKSLQTMMGMEGVRVRALYTQMADKYGIQWIGRRYTPGKIEASDKVNRILTYTNSLLYAVITSSVVAQGLDPRVGFIHSGSPLPFVYDLSDLYKEYLTIDLSFSLSSSVAKPTKSLIAEEFVNRAVEFNFLQKLSNDIVELFEGLN